MMHFFRILATLLLTATLVGCASMASQRMAGHLKTAMVEQDDPETVRAAAPAFLLLTESLIAEQPNNADLLGAGSELSAAYAALLDDPDRRRRLTERSYDYATRALCADLKSVCEARDGPYEDFTAAVDRVGQGGLDTLYVFGVAWAGWMDLHAGDWETVADLPKLEYVFEHVLDQDPGFGDGRAQVYAGALAALRPPSLGGNPEKARGHFEEALRLTNRRDLVVQVEYARRYARLTQNRELHDRLLNEALSADSQAPGLTLTNVLAQEQAALLLAENYFSE
jgi:hypothetical protein